MKRTLSVSLFLVAGTLICSDWLSSAQAALEVITVRSGQSGGVPGTAGQLDDIINYNPGGNPGGSPLQATPFTGADFLAANGGADAVVIDPVSVWMGGAAAPLSDPLARWINFTADPQTGWGSPSGSALYAVPFTITSATIPQAILYIEGGADDGLGDLLWGGPNTDGLYVNGVPSGLATLGPSDFNYGSPTSHVVNITASVTPGLNYLYFYQRDQGFGVSGLIFSARVEIVPEPSTLGLLATGLLLVVKRRWMN